MITPKEIKALRKRLKLSQEALAHLIGVTFQTVNRWETGAFKPSRLALEKIKNLQKSIKQGGEK